MVNGNRLHISHVGSSTLKISGSVPLLLKNVLHVPDIAKNLISISKLTHDNDVLVEFFPVSCCVKDKTGQVILQGALKDGLYCINN